MPGLIHLPSITEKAFMAQVVQLAKLYRWMVYHTHDSRRSAAGFPDLVLVRERVLWVELKTDKGKMTAEQEQWVEALRRAGEEVYVWRPKMWSEIEMVLE